MRRVTGLGIAGAVLCLAPVTALVGSAPGEAAATPAGGGQDLVAPTRPSIAHRNTGMESSSYNWAGYVQVASPGTYTGITSTFVVTTVDTGVPGAQYSADWIGIGGFSDAKLVQAGIEEDNVNGTAFYQAWTEILPHPEVPLSLSVAPGDVVTVTIREIANRRGGNKRWAMTVADLTTGQSAGRTVHYKSFGDSAEAIHERPCLANPCSSHLADLATTSDEIFDPAYTTSSAPTTGAVYHPLLTDTAGESLYDIVMIGNDGSTVISTPSNANGAGDGFVVADGSTVPAAPAH
jgi:hypothetical protein